MQKNYNRVAKSQQALKYEYMGLRSFNNRVKALLIQYLVRNANTHTIRNTDGFCHFMDACCGRGGDFLKWDAASKVYTVPIVVWGLDAAKDAVAEAARRVDTFNAPFCTYIPLCGNVTDYDEAPGTQPKLAGVALHFCMNYLWSHKITGFLIRLRAGIMPGGLVSVVFTNADNMDLRDESGAPATSYVVHIGKLVDGVEERSVNLPSLVNSFKLAGFTHVKSWKHLDVVPPDTEFFGGGRDFAPKPPLPMSSEEWGIMKCYSACIFKNESKLK